MYIDADPSKRSYEMYMFFLGIGYCANIGGTGTVAAEETNLIIMVIKIKSKQVRVKFFFT